MGCCVGTPKGHRSKGGIPGLSHAPRLLSQLGGFSPGTVGGDQRPGPLGKVPARSPLRSHFLRLMVNRVCPLENNLTRFWQCPEWGGAAGSRLWLWVGAAAAPTGPGRRRTDVRTPPTTGPPPGPLCPLSATFLWAAGGRLAAPDLGTPASTPPQALRGPGAPPSAGRWCSPWERLLDILVEGRGQAGGRKPGADPAVPPAWVGSTSPGLSFCTGEGGLLPAEALGEGSSKCRAGAAVQPISSHHPTPGRLNVLTEPV